MSDRAPAAAGHSAGSLLRQARERQGLHIAALAAAIKVAPRKLDSLENDRWDELPDATFTRALAQTVCRTLKIDPVPVLALLPSTDPDLLDTVSGSLNTPFSSRDDRTGGGGAAAVRPMALGGLLLLVAAIGVYLMPSDLWTEAERIALPAGVSAPVAAVASAALDAASQALVTAEAAASSASAAAAAEPAVAGGAGALSTVPSALTSAAAVESVASLQPTIAAAASVPAAASSAPVRPATGAGPATLRALQPTWVSARDANGNVLLSRLLDTGETVSVGGSLPLSLTIGNAAGTELDFRGQKVDLTSRTRDNVARLELQ
ncbi:MAG: helix-turn-helix domain-containing protein [Burkholderiales bacterium]|jgi:cytoskeleton protein RodZ